MHAQRARLNARLRYVEIAVWLGTTRDYRRAIRARIAETSDVLLENYQAVPGLENFFAVALESGLD